MAFPLVKILPTPTFLITVDQIYVMLLSLFVKKI